MGCLSRWERSEEGREGCSLQDLSTEAFGGLSEAR